MRAFLEHSEGGVFAGKILVLVPSLHVVRCDRLLTWTPANISIILITYVLS